MSEQIDNDPTLMGDDPQRDLWQALERVAQVEPAQQLRQRVMDDIHQRSAHANGHRWLRRLLFAPQPALGMMLAAVFGIAIGLGVGRSGNHLDQRMASLETQLVAVNQQLLMSRLNAASPSERLAAALQAATLTEPDPVIAGALLERAATDAVPSVRSAAIAALGRNVNSEATSMQILRLLVRGESPIVQMAIVDLVLRHGDRQLLRALQEHVKATDIHPSLAGYVSDTIGEMEI
ncbi:MAG: HEAT repeat domain-containing protein [Pseudomonadota bacterium]